MRPGAQPSQWARLETGGLIDRARPVHFTFDGHGYVGFAGDTLASALVANGVRLLGRSFKYHRPRGLLSAGPEEPNALVELRSGARREPNTRATTTELFEGLQAVSQNRWPSLRHDLLAAGQWLAVVFSPEDVRLTSGPAAGRRLFLDRTLALSDPAYLTALGRYRAALAQRNAALRQGRPELAAGFNAPLAGAGAVVVAKRAAWVREMTEPFIRALVELGESSGEAELGYHGALELADPGAWQERLQQVEARDAARRMTTVGPHRDDLTVRLGGHALRDYGSTGQHRSAAIALKLLELETLERATGSCPALLLDDVFAELDSARQTRLSARLFGGREAQVFVTSPRADELPAGLSLPVWRVEAGEISG